MSSSPPPRPPARRDVFLAFILVLLGLVLLLPGICAVVFVSSDPKEMLTDSFVLLVVVVSMAISAGGVALIWFGVRRPKP